ncbi:DUF4132 domain-containing protein [Streptomyces chattanoogensis]|uniref:DUF4132 domain-containing protein n=1 Tax=Streptomyces chattanoogensis TaxID=66876 RepID=A0A0N0GY25_9ACTN|nr:DUF4132 domain-containing protein [Streptomyces chattanoogensis]KPC61190.1 hypothetical protein ADL29_25800 [Streptomyces chattanoogensis]
MDTPHTPGSPHTPHPSATKSGLPDENTFTVPEAWLPGLHPWRGGPTVPAAGVDAGAVDAARRMTEERLSWVAGLSGDPELLEAAQAQVRGEPSPLGAAVVAAVVTEDMPWREREKAGLFADAWAAEHGLVFAAEATAELGGVFVEVKRQDRTKDVPHAVRYRRDDDLRYASWHAGERIAKRVRALLAAAGEATYREAVEALADRRRGPFQRAVACYLVPTQAEWVDELFTAAARSEQDEYVDMVLSSLSSMEQLDAFRAHDNRWHDYGSDESVRTAIARIGPAIVPALTDIADTKSYRSELLYAALGALPTDEALGFLVARLDRRNAHAAVIEAMERYPVRALRLLATAASDGGPDVAAYAAALLRRHALAHPELTAAVPPTLPAAAQAEIDRAARGTGWIDDAPAEALPRLLADPPWTRPRPKVKPAVVKGLVAPADPAVAWAPGERQEWAGTTTYYAEWDENTDWHKQVGRFRNLTLRSDRHPALFLGAPEELVRPLLAGWQPEARWDAAQWMRPVVARFGVDALPAALHVARLDSAACGGLLLPFAGAEVATLMADWLATRKKVRPVVHAWFRRHAAAAARALVPAALGKAGKARRQAEAALRLIVSQGGPEAVRSAARGYGDKAAAALEVFLDRDPLDVDPSRVRDGAGYRDLHLLPRVLLRDRRHVLPVSAVGHLVTMLLMSEPDEPYAGLEVVKEVCDPESLAGLGWALFQPPYALNLRPPSPDDWSLTALGLLGNDETVRGLTPLIRSWPGDGGHNASVAGLNVLTAIGTDVALTHLNGIAQKSKYGGIQRRAQQKISELARERGLTADELADRLVPGLDLDEAGSMTLDYGRRRFTVGFDEQLRPCVADGTGKRLKTLPKPGVRDDQDLAPAAHKRFAALKKDLRPVAADQIRRLERAMVTQRRWTTAEFRELIVGHPLLWHIARRLVWVTDDGRSFRLAEDRTLADVHDETLTLTDAARVGIAHPLHLAGTLDAWMEVFADYELLQPFDQLARPAYPLTDDERTAKELKRFADRTVPTVKVLGMERRGWERGTAEDNGIQSWISRVLPGDRAAVVSLDPGIAVGHPDYWPEQRIAGVRLSDGTGLGRRSDTRELSFGALDPVTASEILADLTDLTN